MALQVAEPLVELVQTAMLRRDEFGGHAQIAVVQGTLVLGEVIESARDRGLHLIEHAHPRVDRRGGNDPGGHGNPSRIWVIGPIPRSDFRRYGRFCSCTSGGRRVYGRPSAKIL